MHEFSTGLQIAHDGNMNLVGVERCKQRQVHTDSNLEGAAQTITSQNTKCIKTNNKGNISECA